MKYYVSAFCISLLLSSCEKKIVDPIAAQKINGDSSAVPEVSKPVESSTLQTCYLGVTGKDSVFISLDDNLGTTTGKLRFKNSEKDSSTGDIIGTQNGDTLKLNYTFASEGVTSEREIYFLKKDGNLVEGLGEHQVQANKDMYLATSKLKYEGSVLKKTDCKNFEKNFSSK